VIENGMFVDAMRIEEISGVLLNEVLSGTALSNRDRLPRDLTDDEVGLFVYGAESVSLDEAEALFRMLCMYDFTNAEYVISLATILRLRKEYVKSIDLYALAYELSGRDLRPVFLSGQCYLLMGRTQLARRNFDVVVQSTTDERLKQAALSYLHGLDGENVGERKSKQETLAPDSRPYCDDRRAGIARARLE
jgi:tetratricopeptide (TPR) repeat protein